MNQVPDISKLNLGGTTNPIPNDKYLTDQSPINIIGTKQS